MEAYKEQDMFYTQAKSGYVAMIRKRMGGKHLYGTDEVSKVFNKSIELIRMWIEEGRLPAVDTNSGRVRNGNPVRAHYTITRTAILELAEKIEKGQ